MKQSRLKHLNRTGLAFALLFLSIITFSQVSITNIPASVNPQSLLHIHSNSASGQILQLTNNTSGHTQPTYGFSIRLDPNFRTIFVNQYNHADASIVFSTNDGSENERLVIRNNVNVGIGISDPGFKLDIKGDLNVVFPYNTGHGLAVSGVTDSPLAYINNDNSGGAVSVYGSITNSAANFNSAAIHGRNLGWGYGVLGQSSNGYGVHGYHLSAFNSGYLGGSDYGVYGMYYNSGNYGALGTTYNGVLGFNSGSGNYGLIGSLNSSVYGYLNSNAPGDYAVQGYGVIVSGMNGTGYGVNSSLGSVKGFNWYGNTYTFAVAGYTWLDFNRSGGTFGGYQGGTAPWGCLGYKNSAGTNYGGYFTSSTSGGGKSPDVMINSGISAWGDLFGADIHGHVYGLYTEGSEYASFANGTVIRNGMDVHLHKVESGKEVALYTNVSTDMTVQTAGYATLSGGFCEVEFDPSFLSVVSKESPVIVTITPMGNTSGIYLSEVTEDGFRAVENNDGRSNVKISYIAIGKRAGYESPKLPRSVMSGDHVKKVTEGLHNDVYTDSDGKGLYFENGELHTGIHPSTGPDPSKPVKDPHVPKMEHAVVQSQ